MKAQQANYVSSFLDRLEGVQEVGEGRWKALCPAHDDHNPSLAVTLNNEGVLVIRCVAGCKSERVLEKVGLNFAALYPPTYEEPVLGSVESQKGGPKGRELPAAKWHELYETFLGGLTLSSADRKALKKRGLTDEAIDTNGYKSLDWVKAVRAIKKMVERFKEEQVLLTPGFRRPRDPTKEGIKVEPVRSTGLLIPVRGLDGKILGLQVRTGGDPKYVWFSGAGSPSVGSPAHLRTGGDAASEVRVVEGPLKADVVHALDPSRPVIGIAGVSSWPSVVPVLEALKPPRIDVALDADWKVNAGVAKALVSLLDAVEGKHEAAVETWDLKDGKGLDDLLAKGKAPTSRPRNEVYQEAAEVAKGYKADVEQEAPGDFLVPTTVPDRAERGIRVYRASDLGMDRITWLWEPWIPNGALVMLEGDPAVGKGLLIADLAARLTTGSPFPPEPRRDGRFAPQNVLIASSEDSMRKVLNPRLKAAGADWTRVFFLGEVLDGKEPRLPVLPHDLDFIKERVDQHNIRLIILDPLNAFLDPEIDANKDSEVRATLSKLFVWLDKTDLALVAIRHLNKDTSMKAIHRGVGSVAYTAQARVGMLVAEDPETPNRRLLVQTKNNWASRPRGLAYLLDNVTEIEGLDGPVKLARVEWDGEVEVAADDLAAGRNREGTEDRELAREVLTELLGDGPCLSSEVEACGREHGISPKVIRNALKDLKVKARQFYIPGRGRKWVSAVPGADFGWNQDRVLAYLTEKGEQHDG